MNYYKRVFEYENVDIYTVMQWIKDNYPDTDLDHTTFQDSKVPSRYFMVSYLGSDDCGFEECVEHGISEWKEWNGVRYNCDHSTYLLKYEDVYWLVTY